MTNHMLHDWSIRHHVSLEALQELHVLLTSTVPSPNPGAGQSESDVDDGYPGAASTNAQDIAREFSDVLAIVEMLEEVGALERQTDTHAIERKKARVSEYMTYAERCGTLLHNV